MNQHPITDQACIWRGFTCSHFQHCFQVDVGSMRLDPHCFTNIYLMCACNLSAFEHTLHLHSVLIKTPAPHHSSVLSVSFLFSGCRHKLADKMTRKTLERGDFRLLHYAGEVTYCVVGKRHLNVRPCYWNISTPFFPFKIIYS